MSCLSPWWPPIMPGQYLLCLALSHSSKRIDLATFLAHKLWTWEVPRYPLQVSSAWAGGERTTKRGHQAAPKGPQGDGHVGLDRTKLCGAWSEAAGYRNFKQHGKTALVWLSKEGQQDDQIRLLRMFHSAGGKGKEAHMVANLPSALQNQSEHSKENNG